MGRAAIPAQGPGSAEWLASERGREALAAAATTRGEDPLARRKAIERAFAADEARAALAQDDLRARAAAKTPLADLLLFTKDALEQATPSEVAKERAERFAFLPATETVADLGAGIGLDAIALARAGHRVVAVERDPTRATCLRHNVAAAGVGDRVEIREGDFVRDPPAAGAAFLDPDRRPGGKRTRDLAAFQPPPAAWRALAARYRHLLVKLPPSIAPEALADEWPDRHLEWVSLRGEMKEARAGTGALEGVPPRRALLLPSRAAVEGRGGAWPPSRAPQVGDALLDPDPAVVVAGLVGDAAGARFAPIHPRIAYLLGTLGDARDAPWADVLRVDAVLGASPRALQAWLDAEGIGSLEIRSRGVADPPDAWRKRLRPRGTRAGTLVLTRGPDDRYLGLGASVVASAGRRPSVEPSREAGNP